MEWIRDLLLGGDHAQSTVPVIAVLLRTPVAGFVPDAVERIAALDPLPQPPTVQYADLDALPPGVSFAAQVEFAWHSVLALGFAMPMPVAEAEPPIEANHWPDEAKNQLYQHSAYVLLRYAGRDFSGIEQYMALYRTALALDPTAIIGVLNPPAMTSHPADILHHLARPELFKMCRESPPLPFWTGFLMLQWQDRMWFVSRGFHHFGLPDLAYKSDSISQPLQIQQRFSDVFEYLFFGKPDVQAGDLVQLEDVFFEFEEQPELQEALRPPSGLWVLSPRTRQQAEALMEAQGHRTQGQAHSNDNDNDTQANADQPD
jgi:hypothetical protein